MTFQIGKSGLVTQSPPREPNYGIFTVSWFEKTTLSNIWFLKFPTKQQLHDYLGENIKLTMSAVCIIHN
jgi:hypothetical protein